MPTPRAPVPKSRLLMRIPHLQRQFRLSKKAAEIMARDEVHVEKMQATLDASNLVVGDLADDDMDMVTLSDFGLWKLSYYV